MPYPRQPSNMVRVQALHPFDEYVQQPDAHWRLAEAALLFAADRYPRLVVTSYLAELDRFARRVDHLGARTPADQVRALRQVLVEEERFFGNTTWYYDPRNSYLNEVLERRLGIPISLSVVWIDICQQLDWPFVGIGLPGHFIVGHRDAERRLWVDPFGGGRILLRGDCESLAAAACGDAKPLPDGAFVPISPRAILVRMLNNLRVMYVRQEAWHYAIGVLRRLCALEPSRADFQEHLQLAVNRLAHFN